MRVIVRSIALLVVTALSASAQSHPQVRDGFTISFGVGGGTAGSSCDGCDTDRETAPSGYLRIGGAIRPGLILAGEANAWTKKKTELGIEGTLTIGTVNFIAQWYPQPANGFFVSAGVGSGTMALEVKGPGTPTISDHTNGLGYQIGTGYDIRMGRNFSLTPFATYFATGGGKLDSTGDKIDGNVFHVGLGFTWH
jgi:hypothetical protein